MKKLKNKIFDLRHSDGFTIIEVMIVLAVAGVIMLIVLLTVPALQRNSRNTQRRSDATHMVSLVNEFSTNNNGKLPTNVCFSGCAATDLDLSRENFSILTWGGTTNTTFSPATFSSAAALTNNNDQAYIYYGATCNNNAPTSGGGARSFVIYYGAETSSGSKTAQCVGS